MLSDTKNRDLHRDLESTTPREVVDNRTGVAAGPAMQGTVARSRLHEQPLVSLGERAANLVSEALCDLDPVLAALRRTLTRVTRREDHASLVDP